MAQNMFVNLPVRDLPASKAFFTALGYGFNPQFTNDLGACMVVGDTNFVMLLTHGHFSQFTPSPIADATQSTEVLVCLSCESRQAVEDVVAKALAAGGTTVKDPQDHGFMYGHGFRDLDGHIWEFIWMDPTAIRQD